MAENGQGAQTTEPTGAEPHGTEPTEPERDWKAEYEKLLKHSRAWEDKAKRLREKADRYDELEESSKSDAEKLAAGSLDALSWTKHTLNHWLRAAYPAFDASLAYEFLGFLGPDAPEGLAAAREKRPPHFRT